MNVRDAAPLCAVLIFGGSAGIIAGVIGGLYRYISAFFGLTGTYTQLACSVSTVLAGFIAAGLRKFMFDNKKPGWFYGVGTGMICEVIHMLMIFFTNADDLATAFAFVRVCSLPMMLCNGLSVGAAVYVIAIISKDREIYRFKKKHISITFQFWLFVCIVTAYALTGTYTYIVQSKMSKTETESVIKTSIDDVNQDIIDTSDENLLRKTYAVKDEYLSSPDKSTEFLQYLAAKNSVAAIDIIDAEGFITNSNLPEYIGFDMSSGEQSSEFLVLLDGKTEYFVQKYGPQSFNNKIMRKYGGVILPDGGFLQTGYDADEFQDDIDSTVSKIAKNRHIGRNGFIVICDDEWNIVSEGTEYTGQNLSSLGI